MKCTVDRKELANAMAACARVSPTKAVLPILKSVELRAEGDVLEISATDLDHLLRVRVAADVEEPGTVIAPTFLLAELTKKVTGAQVKITRLLKDNIGIEAGETNVRLPFTFDTMDFPTPPGRSLEELMIVSSAVLRALVSATAFAVSNEESRPILNGMFWMIGNGELIAVATNGHRLARRVVRTKGETPAQQFIINPKPLIAALKLLGEASEVSVSATNSHLWLSSARVDMAVRLIEGPYPNYEQVIPREHRRTAMVSTAHLAAVVDRVAILSPDTTSRLLLRFDGDLRIESDAPDMGHAEESLPIQYQGEPMSIGVSAAYLAEVLKHITTDTVRIDMNAPDRALMFRPEADDSFIALLMPLRLLSDENVDVPEQIKAQEP